MGKVSVTPPSNKDSIKDTPSDNRDPFKTTVPALTAFRGQTIDDNVNTKLSQSLFNTSEIFMIIEDPQTVVLEFYRSFDNRNIERAFTFLAENFTAHMAGIPETMDRESFQQFGMEFYSAFSESQHKFQEIIIAQNMVVTCGTFSAKHLGDFKNLPPTGKQIEISVIHIDRVENGRIIEHWGQGDTQGLMQQLGFISIPNPKLLPGIIINAWEKF